MDFLNATSSFESWLGTQTPLIVDDLAFKHHAMREDRFAFFRATYYRWVQHFTTLPMLFVHAPRVDAVGDLHPENYGTWRDGLGRLCWGVNDFDESAPLPYLNDLVRLVAGIMIAVDEEQLDFSPKKTAALVRQGYREAISTGGRPFVIGDEPRWSRLVVANPDRDPRKFWSRLLSLAVAPAVPEEAQQLLHTMVPDPNEPLDLRHRLAGLGNLGKPRFTAVGQYHGGPFAREVKALTRPASAWIANDNSSSVYERLLKQSIRSHDPFLKVEGRWIARRLAPDCRKLELHTLKLAKDKEWLVRSMGFEAGNVHHATSEAIPEIVHHLEHWNADDLRRAAEEIVALLDKDFRIWRKNNGIGSPQGNS